MFSRYINTYRKKRAAIKILNAAYRSIKNIEDPDCFDTAVCNHVEEAGDRIFENSPLRDISFDITDEIAKRIEYTYVYRWLAANGVPAGDCVNPKYLQQYRLLWIKDMIREIKAQ